MARGMHACNQLMKSCQFSIVSYGRIETVFCFQNCADHSVRKNCFSDREKLKAEDLQKF